MLTAPVLVTVMLKVTFSPSCTFLALVSFFSMRNPQIASPISSKIFSMSDGPPPK
jgi:hypothetical protein